MQILLINQTFYPDVAATAQHAHDLALHLVRRGHRVCVVSSRSIYGERGAALGRHEIADGIEIHRVGTSLFGKSSIRLRALDFAQFHALALLKALLLPRPDVVVALTTPPFVALVGWLVRAVKGCAFAYWVMDLYPDVPVACGVMRPAAPLARLCERLHRFCLRHADRVVVLGRCMQRRICAKGVPPERVVRIGAWADHAEIRPLPRAANPCVAAWGLGDRFVVMYSGNLGLGHDVDTMCGAMLELRDRRDILFLFVGGGKRMPQVAEFAREHGLANLRLHPYQPREGLAATLCAADLHLVSLDAAMAGLIVPSKLYGIMAAGRPSLFIGPPDSEIALVLRECGAGFVVANGDSAGLARLITELAADRPLGARVGLAARRALCEKYDRDRACEAWRGLLEELCAGPRPAPDADRAHGPPPPPEAVNGSPASAGSARSTA